jgi:hypothetical protein
MDRSDERRDEATSSSSREGDVLGIGGSTVPKAPGDPTASNDPESVRRRRERAMGNDEDRREESSGPHAGATGIDMGSAGEGTDVSGT